MRKAYLDNIRWVTVMLVVIYHVFYMFNGVTTFGVMGPFHANQYQDGILYMVYPWFMLTLFTVSGMAARFELSNRTEREFVRKRTVKLLVPSTIGILVSGWIMGYYNLIISGTYSEMSAVPKPILYLILCANGIGPMWYIQTLWLFDVLLIPMRRLEKDKLYVVCEKVGIPVLIAFVLLIYGAAQIMNVPVVTVYRFGIYGMGFLIGYFVLSHDTVMEKVSRNWIIFSVLALASGVIFVWRYWGASYPDHAVLDSPVCNIFAWFGTLGMLAVVKKWGNKETAFSKWMTEKSWELYLFHYLPIAASAWYIKHCTLNLPPVVVYIAVGISGFFGAFLIGEIVRRIPVLRWCIMGIERKKKA